VPVTLGKQSPDELNLPLARHIAVGSAVAHRRPGRARPARTRSRLRGAIVLDLLRADLAGGDEVGDRAVRRAGGGRRLHVVRGLRARGRRAEPSLARVTQADGLGRLAPWRSRAYDHARAVVPRAVRVLLPPPVCTDDLRGDARPARQLAPGGLLLVLAAVTRPMDVVRPDQRAARAVVGLREPLLHLERLGRGE